MVANNMPNKMPGPQAAAVLKETPTHGTPLLDEIHPVLQLNDLSDLFLDPEEPIVAVAISSKGLHTPIKRARQKSPDS